MCCACVCVLLLLEHKNNMLKTTATDTATGTGTYLHRPTHTHKRMHGDRRGKRGRRDLSSLQLPSSFELIQSLVACSFNSRKTVVQFSQLSSCLPLLCFYAPHIFLSLLLSYARMIPSEWSDMLANKNENAHTHMYLLTCINTTMKYL